MLARLVLSPTRFIIDCLKRKRPGLVRWWSRLFPAAALLSVVILLIAKPRPLMWPPHGRWYVLLLLILLPGSRIVEIVWAFFGDAIDQVKGVESKTKLPLPERLVYLILSYGELILDFGIIYFFLPNGQFRFLVDGQPTRGFSNIFESVWFSTVTITTTGYGDIVPHGAAAKLLCISQLMAGLILIVIGIGSYIGAIGRVSNERSGNVTKLRASDGAVLGTFTVGAQPSGIAFDGANIWVANQNSNTVTELRSSDGAVIGTFNVGIAPLGVAFDGVNIWVTNENGGNVTKLRASDGTVIGNFAVGINPFGLVFDGVNIWVANEHSNNVTKLRATDGTVLGTFNVGSVPQSLAFDGAHIWVTNQVDNTVTKLRATDGANLGTFPVGTTPTGIAFDGANIWVANSGSASVSKL